MKLRALILLVTLVAAVDRAHADPAHPSTPTINPLYTNDVHARRLSQVATSKKGLVDLFTTEIDLLSPFNVDIPEEFQTPYGANLLADAVIANYELTGYLQIGNLRLTFQNNNLTNTFANGRNLTNAQTSSGGGPNVDTIYSTGYIDVTQGPVLLTIPPSHGIKYWSALFTDPLGYIAYKIITTQQYVQDGGNWVFAREGYTFSQEELLLITKRKATVVTTAYTGLAIIVRTLVSSPDQYPYIYAFQDALQLGLLSGKPWIKPAVITGITPQLNSDARVFKNLTAAQYPGLISTLVTLFQDNPPPSLLRDPIGTALERFGISQVLPFRYNRLTAIEAQALYLGYQLADLFIEVGKANAFEFVYPNVVYSYRTAVYTSDLLYTAVSGDFFGAGMLPEDTLYAWTFTDSSGHLLDASNKSFVLTVDPNDLYVESQGFWSLTIYDKQLNLVPNPINRYAISDRSDWQGPGTPLIYNEDGSITAYISTTRPPASQEPWYSNWLPAPSGPFILLYRFYVPTPAALDGTLEGWPVTPVTPASPPTTRRLKM